MIAKIKKIALYTVIIFVLAIVALGFLGHYLQAPYSNLAKNAQELNELKEQQKTAFTNNIETHYKSLVSAYTSKDTDQFKVVLGLFKRFQKLDYRDVNTYWEKSRITELEQKVKEIPSSQVAANLSIYKQLLSLDPENQRYKDKVRKYQIKRDNQIAEEGRKRLAYEKRVRTFGQPPENSAWDGSVRCVKNYLKEVARDPDSLKFEKWGKVAYNDNDGWLVWCQYRGKNA